MYLICYWGSNECNLVLTRHTRLSPLIRSVFKNFKIIFILEEIQKFGKNYKLVSFKAVSFRSNTRLPVLLQLFKAILVVIFWRSFEFTRRILFYLVNTLKLASFQMSFYNWIKKSHMEPYLESTESV